MDQQKTQESEVRLQVGEEPASAEQPALVVTDSAPQASCLAPRRVHSLLHGIKRSFCTTAWDRMKGTEVARECPCCKAKVYKVVGLDEEQTRELFPERPSRFYQRGDATIMTKRGWCGVVNKFATSAAIILSFFAYALSHAYVPGLYYKIPFYLWMGAIVGFWIGASILFRRRGLLNEGTVGVHILAGAAFLWASSRALQYIVPYGSVLSYFASIALVAFGSASIATFCIKFGFRKLLKRYSSKLVGATTPAPEAAPERKTESAHLSPSRIRTICGIALSAAFFIIGFAIWDGSWYYDFKASVGGRQTAEQSVQSLKKMLPRSFFNRKEVVELELGNAYRRTNDIPHARESYEAVIRSLEGTERNNQVLAAAHKEHADLLRWYSSDLPNSKLEYLKTLELLNQPNAGSGGMRMVFNFYRPLERNQKSRFAIMRSCYTELAVLETISGNPRGAEEWFQRTLRPFPGEDFDHSSLFNAVLQYTSFLRQHHRTDDAIKAVEDFQHLCHMEGKGIFDKYLVADGLFLYQGIESPRAIEAMRRQIRVVDATGQDSIWSVQARLELVRYLLRHNQLEQAEDVLKEALDVAQTKRTNLLSYNVGLVRACEDYASFLAKQKRFDEADKYLQLGVDETSKPVRIPESRDDVQRWRLMTRQAKNAVDMGDPGRAFSLMQAVDQQSAAKPKVDPLGRYQFMRNYTELMQRLGKHDQAVKYAAQIAEVDKQNPHWKGFVEH